MSECNTKAIHLSIPLNEFKVKGNVNFLHPSAEEKKNPWITLKERLSNKNRVHKFVGNSKKPTLNECIGIISCESAVTLRSKLENINSIAEQSFINSAHSSDYNITTYFKSELKKSELNSNHDYFYHQIIFDNPTIEILADEHSQGIASTDFHLGHIHSLHIGYTTEKIFYQTSKSKKETAPLYFVIKFLNGSYTMIETNHLCILENYLFDTFKGKAEEWKREREKNISPIQMDVRPFEKTTESYQHGIPSRTRAPSISKSNSNSNSHLSARRPSSASMTLPGTPDSVAR